VQRTRVAADPSRGRTSDFDEPSSVSFRDLSPGETRDRALLTSGTDVKIFPSTLLDERNTRDRRRLREPYKILFSPREDTLDRSKKAQKGAKRRKKAQKGAKRRKKALIASLESRRIYAPATSAERNLASLAAPPIILHTPYSLHLVQ